MTEQELDAAIPDFMVLDREEKRGWEELSHWADDADIRAKDEIMPVSSGMGFGSALPR